MHIREAHAIRDAIFDNLLAPKERGEYASQHDVYPCVRRGVGERWLEAQGRPVRHTNTSALYFLRGHSAEALIGGIEEESKLIVWNGIAFHPDLDRQRLERMLTLSGRIVGEGTLPKAVAFGEIKSTNLSSFNSYKLAEQQDVSLAPDNDFTMRAYFEQCRNYCIAQRADSCVLIVYTLHGDYADRRTKCPACANKLSDWIDDRYKECGVCGYKSKKIDLWAYFVTFTKAELQEREAELIDNARVYYAAIASKDETEILTLTNPTECYQCKTCEVGKAIGCENAGKDFGR